ncbi:hypothetical protein QTP70_019543, partial [Hemibagrus guttatus]
MGPPTFSWLTKYLGEVVRPAKITPETKTLLDGNAKNWSYTNRLILQDHYAQCIDREVDELQGLVVTNWSPAFTRAEKKYRNKYKKRHVREAIEKVKAILTALWDEPAQVPTPEQVLASEQASPPTEVNLQEERLSEDTEFPTTAPQPTFPTTTTPQFPPPRSPRAPRRNQEEGYINRKQLTYLRGVDNPRTRRFYLLPKIHKDPKSWSIPFEMPPGRPIVSDCGSNTYATAEFIEHYLNPISNQHPSYIRDTYDFIDKVRNLVLPIDCFLFTIDIDSLYTNIGTSAGVEAIMEWFKRYPDGKKPDKHVIDLLKINLTENDFEFNSEYFLQVKGTAMGKRFAPSYANIFMAKWEEEALSAWPIKPLHYFRFLDDIWGVWKESEKEFK